MAREMNINWYPGHMKKAERMMEENLRLVDAVVEVRDARIPESSRNPDVEKALALVRQAAGIAPCYYVTGNHDEFLRRYSTLLNSVPLYLCDKPLPPLDFYAVYLTTETQKEAASLIRAAIAHDPPQMPHTTGLAFRKLL